MSKRSLFLVVAGLAALGPASVAAQQRSDVTPVTSGWTGGRVTVGGAFGGLSGAANLDPQGTATWKLGWQASLDVTGWLTDYVGVRASGGWAQDSIQGAALAGRGRFNKFTYDADLVLRYPIHGTSGTLSPYLLAGAGAISVHQLGATDSWSKFAGNFGAGLEYRFGRVGLRAEGRDFVYTFDRYSFNKTQHDVAWQGGITLSF